MTTWKHGEKAKKKKKKKKKKNVKRIRAENGEGYQKAIEVEGKKDRDWDG